MKRKKLFDHQEYEKLESVAGWVVFVIWAAIILNVIIAVITVIAAVKAEEPWFAIILLHLAVIIGIWVSGSVVEAWLSHLCRMEKIAWEGLGRMADIEKLITSMNTTKDSPQS